MPLLIVLVIVAAVVIGTRIMRRRGQAGQETGAQLGRKAGKVHREVTRENAEAASARLTPEEHRRVYSLIAQRQVLNAVKEYREATRLGLGDAAAAVAALAQFPQPTPEKVTQPKMPVESPAAIKDGPLTVEDIIGAAPDVAVPAMDTPSVERMAPSTYRYRAIVSQGEEIREVTSTRLNEQIFSEIRALARAGKHDDATALLRSHADIGETEAQEFVSMIGPED
ncbi:hypothetical protein CVS30_01775 [Arthrobacter psychrolactophilus]|uniref:Uncharacterized protein n=1 Tax=Arthrobacter psychrolactophilus TaxID=92442 RepID=A0A2V5IUS1_9MICC|nr:hypothetical protein [Arthrobacter psychrolactophilus]PYI40268.1 hypothetical protein CVS30_01775 [Arthrobacter psychrolactophilus]